MKQKALPGYFLFIALMLGMLQSVWAQNRYQDVDQDEMSGMRESAADLFLPPGGYQGTRNQARHFYSNGSLINADALPLEGQGYVKIFRAHDRRFGTFDILQIIQNAARLVAQGFPEGERLRVGDIAQREGGYISGHDSHQNGLDADLGYFRTDHLEQDPTGKPPGTSDEFDEVYVHDGRVSEKFDLERNWALITALTGTGRVNRIFVDVAIKRILCKLHAQPEAAEVLHFLRPWPAHDDHLHVRITCPSHSPGCQSQVPVLPGSGCSEVER